MRKNILQDKLVQIWRFGTSAILEWGNQNGHYFPTNGTRDM